MMRCAIAFILAALIGVPAAFAEGNDKTPDPQELASLETKAEQAEPRDQCYLYTKLVRDMTDVTDRQLNSGDVSGAFLSLKTIQRYTAKIRNVVTGRSKKLKDAQIMMRHTAFRLKELMRDGSINEQPAFESTLQDLDQVQSQMMLAVFKK
jgi:hypothetical protein